MAALPEHLYTLLLIAVVQRLLWSHVALSMQVDPPMTQQKSVFPKSSLLTIDRSGVTQTTTSPSSNGETDDATYLIQSRRAFMVGGASAALGACTVCSVASSNRQQIFAGVMANGMKDYESLPEVRSLKSNIFSYVKSGDEVLEIGIGSGPNLRYYGRTALKVFALEPNREFDDYIIQSAAAAKLPTKINIVPGVAEQIPMKDSCVDVIVGTMVMCSVVSVKDSLKEIYRVLKPGGRYIFTEHVAAPSNMPLLTMAQHLADPLQQFFSEGCHLSRDPHGDIIQTFGSSNVDAKKLVLSTTTIGADTNLVPLQPHFLLSPHLVGVATKR